MFVLFLCGKILKKRENRKKSVLKEILAASASRNILLHRQTSILLFFLCACLYFFFLCFVFVILLNAKNHVVFALVFVAVFFVERGVHGQFFVAVAPKPAGGEYFDLTNTEGEPLPIECIGLSNPLVGVDVLMF